MANQYSPIEVNSFVAGLITEASPLTYPPNSSLYEKNFVLYRDGSRSRRLGIDYEEGYKEVLSNVSGDAPISLFKWENAGGDSSRALIVVQVGNELHFLNSSEAVSSEVLGKMTLDNLEGDLRQFSYAVVDGMLVVATGSPFLANVEYKDGGFKKKLYRLLVRDFFGVEDVHKGEDLFSGNGVSTRPDSLSATHLYNLRNQTWALPRKAVDSELLEDLVENFYKKQYGSPAKPNNKYPSNSDVVTYSLYPDANNKYDRLTDRFNARDVIMNPIGSTEAPKGYFIIDLLDRGKSRMSEEARLRKDDPQLVYQVDSLPSDVTPGGATLVAQFAGRVFYAGFEGRVIGGDAKSPRLSSYILFSKLVSDSSDLQKCYQVGDPTSKEEPDLLDTDGGFIRIDGAFGIKKLVAMDNALMVVASNGVWMIQGGSDYGFKATNYLVTKITEYGCISLGSVVVADNTLLYWSEDGIYNISKNQFGDYVATNISLNTIQKHYLSIPSVVRKGCQGVYDSYEKKVSWVYQMQDSYGEGTEILNFDMGLGAFYPHTLPRNPFPQVISGVVVPAFFVGVEEEAITVNGENVTANGELVGISSTFYRSSISSVKFLTVLGTSPLKYTFSSFEDRSFKDFKSFDGVGVDAKAELVTGTMTGGDSQRNKQVPYITFHFKKTEDGFEETFDGDWVVRNPSSCLVSSMWEWTNHRNSGKWSRPFQAYRIRRHYFPTSVEESFDNGFDTVVSKSKLRGRGRALSLLIESEPEKDLHILGWAMIIGVYGSV